MRSNLHKPGRGNALIVRAETACVNASKTRPNEPCLPDAMEQLVGIGSDGAPALHVVVRAYGTQRGGLAEHIEEAIEGALRVENAGAAGIAFDRDADARLSDQLFRARRAGFERIKIQLTALRALCAPVGGLDAADAQAVAFYVRATDDRPLELVLDDADKALPAFVVAKTLNEVICPTPAAIVAVAKRDRGRTRDPLPQPSAAPVAASVTVIDEACAD